MGYLATWRMEAKKDPDPEMECEGLTLSRVRGRKESHIRDSLGGVQHWDRGQGRGVKIEAHL